MNNYYRAISIRLPQLDLLEEIHRSLGYRVKLDDVAQATIGMGKTGHGLQAVEFWKEGKIKELADYCLPRCAGHQEGLRVCQGQWAGEVSGSDGAVHEVPLNIEGVPVQTMSAINLTMPF